MMSFFTIVYYFDTFGNFRQLSCEPTPKPPPPAAPTTKKKRKKGQLRRVIGPSVKYGLEAGESEYTLGPALRIPDVKNMGRDVALEMLRICPCY